MRRNRDNDPWPVFQMTIPCPGFYYYKSGDFQYCEDCKHHYYDSRVYRVRHGDFNLNLKICQHEIDRHGTIGLAISEALSLHYDQARKASNRHSVHAFTTGLSHHHAWEYSLADMCAECGARSARTQEMKTAKQILQSTSAQMRVAVRLGPGEYEKFCSLECFAKNHHRVCSECGEVNEKTLENRFFDYGYATAERAKVRDMTFLFLKTFCSRECCSLAVAAQSKFEWEQRINKEKLKCVHEVRKLMSSARKLLKSNPSPEALLSLKQGFEQVATSQR